MGHEEGLMEKESSSSQQEDYLGKGLLVQGSCPSLVRARQWIWTSGS